MVEIIAAEFGIERDPGSCPPNAKISGRWKFQKLQENHGSRPLNLVVGHLKQRTIRHLNCYADDFLLSLTKRVGDNRRRSLLAYKNALITPMIGKGPGTSSTHL